MVMTKYTVVEKLQSDLGFPKKQALETVESMLEIIKATLESGEDLLVSGFGKFIVKKKMNARGAIRPLVRM
jgi:integration host factor subunit alpha